MRPVAVSVQSIVTRVPSLWLCASSQHTNYTALMIIRVSRRQPA